MKLAKDNGVLLASANYKNLAKIVHVDAILLIFSFILLIFWR